MNRHFTKKMIQMPLNIQKVLNLISHWEKYKTYHGTMKVKVAQSCPSLCDPMDCIVHGIL